MTEMFAVEEDRTVVYFLQTMRKKEVERCDIWTIFCLLWAVVA